MGCPYRKLGQPMTNEVRHLRAVMYKINHRVASVRWREAELFGTYGYFDSFREPFECRFLQAAFRM